ncbi:MAG: DUF3343 domain-containing protein [bacterium]
MLKDILKRKARNRNEDGRGLFLFQEAGQAIRAEKTLKKSNYDVRVMAPPPHLRTGCDLVVAFDIVEQTVMNRLLNESGNPPLAVLPVSDETMAPLDICRVKDFGDYLMVRAANMKITVAKQDQRIVNISGGGCPDVPYLANEMIGKPLHECIGPAKIGFTLCAYTLNVAYEEMQRLLTDSDSV